MVRRNKSKNKNWFRSTLIVLVVLFTLFAIVGITRLGWLKVLDGTILYIIGATFTAIAIIVVTIIIKKMKKK